MDVGTQNERACYAVDALAQVDGATATIGGVIQGVLQGGLVVRDTIGNGSELVHRINDREFSRDHDWVARRIPTPDEAGYQKQHNPQAARKT